MDKHLEDLVERSKAVAEKHEELREEILTHPEISQEFKDRFKSIKENTK